MNKNQNYYEILGIPENAAAGLIKKRYRELVRVYHPDVAKNKTEAHRMFIRISEAYEVLSDSAARNIYDRSLREEREKERRQKEQAEFLKASRHQSFEHSGFGVSPDQKKAAMQDVRAAQMAFIQRRLQTATSLCKEAIVHDPRNAQAHSILGDIYKIRGKIELAIKYYSLALQFDPSDREIERKLTEVLSVQIGNVNEEPIAAPGTKGYYVGRMNAACWTLVAGLLVAVKAMPSPKYVVQNNTVYSASAWNIWLLPVLALLGFLVGAIFAVNRWVGSPSRDLFGVGRLVQGGGIPLGHIAFICSFICFWVSAAIYFLVAIIRGDTSRSVLRLIGATIGILFVTVLLCDPNQQHNVLMWCGNIVFPASVLGWYVGHVLNPIKRYGWSK